MSDISLIDPPSSATRPAPVLDISFDTVVQHADMTTLKRKSSTHSDTPDSPSSYNLPLHPPKRIRGYTSAYQERVVFKDPLDYPGQAGDDEDVDPSTLPNVRHSQYNDHPDEYDEEK